MTVDKKFLRVLIFVLIFILVLNMILLATKKINELVFWIIIIVAAVFSYVVLPRIKKTI